MNGSPHNLERVLRKPRRRIQLANTLRTPKRRRPEGPVARLLQIQAIPELRTVVTRLLQRPFTPDECAAWKHDVRDGLRARLYAIVLKDRPDFEGILDDLDRPSTLHFLGRLQKKGAQDAKFWDETDLDEVLAHNRETAERFGKQKDYSRAATQAYELRKMLAGGLWADDRSFRIDRNSGLPNGNCQYCNLNTLGTVEHWLWHCPEWDQERTAANQVMQLVNKDINAMPPCFRYAGINNRQSGFSLAQMDRIHESLLEVILAQLRRKAARSKPPGDDNKPDAPDDPSIPPGPGEEAQEIMNAPNKPKYQSDYVRTADYNYSKTDFSQHHGHNLERCTDKPGHIKCTICERSNVLQNMSQFFTYPCQGMPFRQKQKQEAEERAKKGEKLNRAQDDIAAKYRIVAAEFKKEWVDKLKEGHKLVWEELPDTTVRTTSAIDGKLTCLLCGVTKTALKSGVNSRQYFERHYCDKAALTGDPEIDTAEGRKAAKERRKIEHKEEIANRSNFDYVLANLEPGLNKRGQPETDAERRVRALALTLRNKKKRAAEIKCAQNKRDRKQAAKNLAPEDP